jgi:hypothetical protein
MNNTDARLWHPWLRVKRVLRVMLHTRWSAEAWSVVRVEFRKALALRDPARGVVQLARGEATAREEAPEGQAGTTPLPGMPPPEPTGTVRVLPMQLQIGDRMTDSTGEWQVVGRPYTTNGGKNAHVRVQRVSQPGVTETKMWGSYEKVAVIRRAPSEGGKQ